MGNTANGIFVTGTDTAVGKTVVTAALARHLSQRGLSIGVMKPIETGVTEPPQAQSDAERLRTAAASTDEIQQLCPYRFERALAPLAAASLASCTIESAEIVGCYSRIAARHDLTLVEGVGGLLVPIGHTWDVRDLIGALALPVIIVGRSALGGINHARLTVEALRTRDIRILAVVLNHTTPISSAVETEQTTSTESLLRDLIQEPVLGPLPYLAAAAHEWQQAVDHLAGHATISALGDLAIRSLP